MAEHAERGPVRPAIKHRYWRGARNNINNLVVRRRSLLMIGDQPQRSPER